MHGRSNPSKACAELMHWLVDRTQPDPLARPKAFSQADLPAPLRDSNVLAECMGCGFVSRVMICGALPEVSPPPTYRVTKAGCEWVVRRRNRKLNPEKAGRPADTDPRADAKVVAGTTSAETRTQSLRDWAGGDRVMLAIVLTDVLDSVALGHEIGDESMNDVRNAHFAQGRELLARHGGREIKTIGDSIMAAFHCADEALDFALALQASTGHPRVHIRAGIHVGTLDVEDSDVLGETVNFAARVKGAIKGADIALSDRAKQDIDQARAQRHSQLKWERRDGVKMKGLPESTLWFLKREV